jgi:hypothetical protein
MPNREKVEFPANIPTIVELDGPGTLQASKNGDDEYRYFLEHERIMWVPPQVHEQIVAAGAFHPGATFQICKHQAKARAPITWEVIEIADEPRGAGYSNAPSPTQPQGYQERTVQGWTHREGPRPQPQPQRHPTSQAPPPAPPIRTQPQPAAQLAADAPEYPTGPADRMAAAMRDAIELWRGASSMEPGLIWNAADVRALAATLFIDGGRK